MSYSEGATSGNTLLNALIAADRLLLQPHLTRKHLARNDILATSHVPVEHVYFLEAGVASIVSESSYGRRTEVGIFGRDGVSSTCLLLGSDRSPHETFIQVGEGTALCIAAQPYLAAINASVTLREMLLKFVQVMLVQSAQTAANNAYQRVEARLARWLLMCHDRVDGNNIALTHEFMSMMISAERSGVTVSLHILEAAGMISAKRGLVIIKDRESLEELAGDSYGVAEAEYRFLIGPLGRSRAARS